MLWLWAEQGGRKQNMKCREFFYSLYSASIVHVRLSQREGAEQSSGIGGGVNMDVLANKSHVINVVSAWKNAQPSTRCVFILHTTILLPYFHGTDEVHLDYCPLDKCIIFTVVEVWWISIAHADLFTTVLMALLSTDYHLQSTESLSLMGPSYASLTYRLEVGKSPWFITLLPHLYGIIRMTAEGSGREEGGGQRYQRLTQKQWSSSKTHNMIGCGVTVLQMSDFSDE